jgi:tRNA(Arg) A34 adenosine deaminase TadA
MPAIDPNDARHMRRAIALAREARERGDKPFGAVLVSAQGQVLGEGTNTETTERDITGHAETNVLRAVCRTHDASALAGATLYASGEPCPMCAGTIFWSGVGRVLYGASRARIRALSSGSQDRPRLNLDCREVLATGTRPTEIIGPVLADEAERVFLEAAG